MAYYQSRTTYIHKLLWLSLVLLGCAEGQLLAVAKSKKTKYREEREARSKDAEARFKKLMEENPDIIEDDFNKIFDFRTGQIDENELKEHLAQRKVWLAQHPDARPIDFNGRGGFHSDEDLRKYLAERKVFLNKYPGSTDDDFKWLQPQHWSEADLNTFFADRAAWLAKNPGKISSDYQEVWREAVEKERAADEREAEIKRNLAQAQFKEIIKKNPVLTEEDFYYVWDYIYDKIDQNKVELLIKQKKAKEQAKIKFNALKNSNPDILDKDFDYFFDFQTRTTNEATLKEHISKRKAWLAQYPGSTADDFHFFENHPFVEKNKPALQKHLSGKADWLKQHPGRGIGDYHFTWVRMQGFGKWPTTE